ncbi:hypothetical protein SAMN06265368_0976 [Cohaesibacter gelatinilyticus]|uniref:Uncharacterized protein n=1 Tax=Cohaesibacter gelatinilyticus TaxID=372072 RepID=A0A285NEY0_9HYPH|nr:hypothetical protein SAMN06265368_0976 [Cohaesibacter gelatinilyticus]
MKKQTASKSPIWILKSKFLIEFFSGCVAKPPDRFLKKQSCERRHQAGLSQICCVKICIKLMRFCHQRSVEIFFKLVRCREACAMALIQAHRRSGDMQNGSPTGRKECREKPSRACLCSAGKRQSVQRCGEPFFAQVSRGNEIPLVWLKAPGGLGRMECLLSGACAAGVLGLP